MEEASRAKAIAGVQAIFDRYVYCTLLCFSHEMDLPLFKTIVHLL